MNKRILSILLAALMLSSSLSLTAFADDAAEPAPDTDVTEPAETPETENPETETPETEEPETEAPETETPETDEPEQPVPEDPAETEPEVPETPAPETTLRQKLRRNPPLLNLRRLYYLMKHCRD